MKDKKTICKILVSVFTGLSIVAMFLPLARSSEIFGYRIHISAFDLITSDAIEAMQDILGVLDSDINYLLWTRIVLIGFLLCNIVSAVLDWLLKGRLQGLVGIIAGLLQTLYWGFGLVAMHDSIDELETSFVHVGSGVYLFLISSIGLVVSNILFMTCREHQAMPSCVRREVVGTRAASKGTLIGLVGEYAGAKLPVGSNPIVLGRDQAQSNLVLLDGQVSRKHCSISYDAYRKFYLVTDMSSNGTYLGDGMRLPSGQVMEINPGTTIKVGANSFLLQ